MTVVPTLRFPIAAAVAALVITTADAAPVRTEATLLIEVDSGKVLHAENATMPWYPASTSKLMTLYVTLQAVKNQRITLDTLVTVTPRASSQAPSKIGLRPGLQVTIDNALKFLMVKSANDMAVVLAEGVSGSVEKFADEMNRTSRNLGMTQSNWVNPNGLPADEQISSARDLAILGRALMHDFPEYELYWHIPAIQFGKKTMRNYNSLIGRYDGADGMKTGFICASGFNLVGSARRNGKRLIVVVLGSPSGPYRAVKAAGLLERGFQRGPLSWLSPSLGTVDSLQPINATPPDLRDEMCGKHRKRPAAEEADDDGESASFMLSNLPPSAGKASDLLKDKPDTMKAIVVFVGAAKTAAANQFANAKTKIQKLAKGKKPDAKTEQAAAPAQATTTTTTGATAPLQAASAPPAGAFTTPANQPQRTLRALPAATDVNNPAAMSYTAPARTEPAPLTAMPAAKPAAAAAKPTPKPDAKQAAKPDAKSATTAAKPAAKPAAAKTEKKPDAKPAAKPAAAKQAAAASKPANGAKPDTKQQ